MKRSTPCLALSLLAAAAVVATPHFAQARAVTQAPAAATTATQPPAQTPLPVPPPQPPAASQNRNVQVDVTVNLQGGASPVSKKMTLVAAENTVALGRSGIEVPVTTSRMGGAATAEPIQSYSYRSVGLNVDVRPRIIDGGRILLMVKLEFSAVLKPDGTAPSMPAFSKANTDLNLSLESGKPLLITQSADAEIGRGYTVEVKATLLK